MKIIYIIYPLIFISIMMCFVFQYVVSNEMVLNGKSIGDIENQITQIQEENEFLKKQLSQAQSYAIIEKKADDLGFVKPSQFITIPVSYQVALR